MSAVEFFQTKMGHRFYEGDVPAIVEALRAIAKQLPELTSAVTRAANELQMKPAVMRTSEREQGLMRRITELGEVLRQCYDVNEREIVPEDRNG